MTYENILTLETPETMTAIELKHILKDCRTLSTELKRESERLFDEWRNLPLCERINTAYANRLVIDAEECEKKHKLTEKIYFIIRSNYRNARYAEIQPILAEILKKYDGKPYGEKTAEKMKNELFKRCKCCFFIARHFSFKMDIYEMDSDGFPNGEKFDVWTRSNGNFLIDNKINASAFDGSAFSMCHPYSEKPFETVKLLSELEDKAKLLKEEFKTVCRQYDDIAPENFKRLV